MYDVRFAASKPGIPNSPTVTRQVKVDHKIDIDGRIVDAETHKPLDWAGHELGEVEFRLNGEPVGSVPAGKTTARIKFDVGSRLIPALRPGANFLEVTAVDAKGVRSEVYRKDIGAIPVPALLALSSALGVKYELSWGSTPGYRATLRLPDREVSGFQDMKFLGRFGANFFGEADFGYTIPSAEWEATMGVGFSGRWRGRVGARPKWKFYIKNQELEGGLGFHASGTASPTAGLVPTPSVGVRTWLDYKGEIFTIRFTDLVPVVNWAGLAAEIAFPGADINSIQRIRCYGLLHIDGTTKWSHDGGSYRPSGGVLSPSIGVEAAYEPEFGSSFKARLYVGGQFGGTITFPVAGDITVAFNGSIYGGYEIEVFSFSSAGKFNYTWGGSGSPPTLHGGWSPVSRSYLLHGPERFLAGEETRALLSPGGGGRNPLQAFRLLGTPSDDVSGTLPNRPGRAALAAGTAPPLGPQADLVIAGNITPHSDHALAAHGTGLMLVYVGDGGGKEALQFSDIHWTRWDGTNWTRPRAIRSDTRAEFAPQVAFDGRGNAVAVWQRVADPAFTKIDVTAMAAEMEIVGARWDRTSGEWSEPEPITANRFLDHSPRLGGPFSDGSLLLVWTANEGNRLSGAPAAEGGTPDRVLWTRWDPDAARWALPQTLLESVTHRFSDTLAGATNRAVYAWSIGLGAGASDGLRQAVSYRVWTNGLWGAVRPAASGPDGARNPRVAVAPSGEVLLFSQQGTNLVLERNFAGVTRVVREGADSAGFADYEVTAGPGGRAVLLWSEMNEEGADPYYSVLDPASGGWSQDLRLVSDRPLGGGRTAHYGVRNLRVVRGRSGDQPQSCLATARTGGLPHRGCGGESRRRRGGMAGFGGQ